MSKMIENLEKQLTEAKANLQAARKASNKEGEKALCEAVNLLQKELHRVQQDQNSIEVGTVKKEYEGPPGFWSS